MARDASTRPGRWREGRGRAVKSSSPKRASTAKWTGALLLAAMLVGVIAVTSWIVWHFVFPNAPSPYFVAFWIGEFQQRSATERGGPQGSRISTLIPPIPWMEADRKALAETKVFTRVDASEDQTSSPPKEVMETRLQSLRSLKPKDSVVVYLAAYATVDANGKIQILAYDSNPYRPDTLLPLSAILTRLKECPARHKLLVLDIMRNTPDPFDLGGTADGVADLVRKHLQTEADPKKPSDGDLLVIGSCSGGQTALGSEGLGHSVFGHFFRLGLTIPEADTDRNRAISVTELAHFLEQKVDQWAQHYRGIHQRPFLAGSGPDFPLAALTQKKSAGTWTLPWQKSSPPKSKVAVQAGEKATDKDATAEKATDKGKIAEKAPDKGGATAKAEGKASELEGAGYPPWLADAWAVRESWEKADDFLAAPRAFRRLEAILLRAEQRWRGGDDPKRVQGELAGELRELQAAMEQARRIPQPRELRSFGQAKALGWQPDGELAAALKKLLVVPLSQIDAKMRKDFLAKFEKKTGLDLTAAIVESVEDKPFDPKTLEFLDSLVTESQFPRDTIELRFLKQLAGRAKVAPVDWSDATAKQAWTVVVMAEEANNRPSALPWVRDELTRADALRHSAEVLLLRQAAGYVSSPQITTAWDQAQRAYETVENFQARIQTAQTERGRSLAMLRVFIPYLEAAGDPEIERTWFETAEATRRLDHLLERPEQPMSAEQLGTLNRELNDASVELNRLVRVLERPFQASELRDLAERSTSSVKRPDPSLSGEINAILSTPFPSPQERQMLWVAGRRLDERLDDMLMSEPEVGSGSDDGGLGPPQERLGRRARRLATLIRLANEEETARSIDQFIKLTREATRLKNEMGDDLRWDLTDAGKVWSGLAAYVRLVRAKFEELVRQKDLVDSRDRTGWVAPVFMLDWQSNPTRQGRVRDAREAWAWLAEHYIQQGHDVYDPELDDTPKYYEKAAWDSWTCDPGAQRASELPPETYLEIKMMSPPSLELSRDHPSAEVVLQFLLHSPEGEKPQTVDLSVLRPDDPRLRVTDPKPAALELAPETSSTASLRVEWNEDGPARPASITPNGFLIRGALSNRRTYHLPVPTNVVSESMRPRLVLGNNPTEPNDLLSDRLRLRPIPGQQPFYVFVRNVAPTPRDVVVELLTGGVQPPVKMKVEANSTQAVPSFGAPPPKPADTLARLTEPVHLLLREGRVDSPGQKVDGAGQKYDEKKIVVGIASREDYLSDYLEVTQAQFVPANQAGEKNRLTVVLKALRHLTGPPCAVDLVLPKDEDLFPALRESPNGTLSGILEPGKTLNLFAEGLVLDPAAPADGSFYLNIDGIERALWFKTSFVLEGGTQRAFLDERPRVRFQPEIKPGPPSAKLVVRFTVDNAPADAKLITRLGQVVNGEFIDGIPRWTDAAKEQNLGFDARGDKGALLFEAGIKDWIHVFNTPRIRGERLLEARLLDAGGKVLDRYSMHLMLDDQPPEIVSLELPNRIRKGTAMLKVKGSVTPPASGIKEVIFFAGLMADLEKAKAAGQAVLGRPTDVSRRTWEAMLPLPKDAVGAIPVTARFTTGVGLTGFIAQDVTVIAPPPVDVEAEAEKAKKKQPPAPGAIKGKVVEGNLAQPGLVVYLYAAEPDPKDKGKPKPLASAETAAGGAYAFKDLNPGRYQLYSVKPSNNRRALKDVTVEPGETAAVNLELLLP